jgi:PadR family transcriptional regulator, regulatory protein PadR
MEKHLGEFEQLILLAVVRLEPESYGMKIKQELEDRAGRKTSVGALYTALDRLEQKGFVTSELGEATAERGGRAKRYFAVSPSGKDALKQSLREISSMARGRLVLPEGAI